MNMYKVLLVGSIEYNTRSLASMPVWDAAGFRVSGVAHNGNTALTMLREEKYDLVITEIWISGLDGLQLLRHVNQEKLCPVVIIMSDTVKFEYVRESILFGAFDYLKLLPDPDMLSAVLNRARENLAWNGEVGEDKIDSLYPTLEEERIVQNILNHGEDTTELFEKTLEQIYTAPNKQTIEKDLLVKKLYSNVISKVFEKNKWLYNYVDIEYYKKLDYLWAGTKNGYKDFFVRKFNHLVELYNRLYLSLPDKGLQSLILYILEHPEEDLRLKTIAKKIFLNYSYLSSNFAAKAGIRYNEYIVNLRMARAAYLLLNTDMKVYEVCAAVSYQDNDYFTRRFKKIYNMSPSEYKSLSGEDNSLDYSGL